MTSPSFSLGIEEEYLLVHRESGDLAEAPAGLMEACQKDLQDQVSPEYLQCQIEVGTRVCADIDAARTDLRHLRSTIARRAAEFDLAPIAVSCHPFSDWKRQSHTRKERYDALHSDLAGVAERLLICGMHVHVGLDDDALRIDLLPQLSYFLPHLLALSASSPLWRGDDTGLCSYRLTVFDNLPRTGLPPRFESWADYEATTGVLIDLGIIEDTSKIWWDLRPSHRFPTLETRICDVCPRLEHALGIAALTRALLRMLWRLRRNNQRWRQYDSFLINENRWRAQRYGTGGSLIDFGAREKIPYEALFDDLLELVSEDLDALGGRAEVEALRDLVSNGCAADRQRAVRRAALEAGADLAEANRAVVRYLAEEFTADL
ncbi:MAG: carboxylate-amine ligase [Mangrovicoccus sp.]|nr:carboxylate-amine ligase [Mangrovicoccus sp.]